MPYAVNVNLPVALQNRDVAFCFGASWMYRSLTFICSLLSIRNGSELDHLFERDSTGSTIVTGVSIHTPTWTLGAEAAAVPLINDWQHLGVSQGTPAIGENSVRWHPVIGRWVFTAGSAEYGGAWARLSTNSLPWVWTDDEVRIMVNGNQTTLPTFWHGQAVRKSS